VDELRGTFELASNPFSRTSESKAFKLSMTVAAPERKIATPENKTGVDSNASSARAIDLYELLLHPSMLRVGPCLVGIVIGFLLCCIAGNAVARTNFYGSFHRFTDYTSPTTLFYPTVSQMVAMVNLQSTPDQTVVIIGGNSIFNGVGQRASEIWTDRLREQLGHSYAVFNFASCGEQPFEGAYWVAESLLTRGRKVLYVTVAMPTAGGAPEGGKVYGYLYWDAHEKKFLARSPERESLIERRIAMMDDKEKERIAELKLRMQLDKLLHFQDLWTAVGYTQVFTVWTQHTEASPFMARRLYADLQPDPVPVASRFSKSPAFARELSTVRAYCDGFFDITPIRWQEREQAWSNLLTEMKGLVPDQFKKNCLVVVACNPPYFLHKITPAEHARIVLATAKSEECWRSAGYHAVAAAPAGSTTINDKVADGEFKNAALQSQGLKGGSEGFEDEDFKDEDFKDCWHLTGSGGRRMAALVARRVVELNRELGFSDNGGNQ
jgi:hypothetical protein